MLRPTIKLDRRSMERRFETPSLGSGPSQLGLNQEAAIEDDRLSSTSKYDDSQVTILSDHLTRDISLRGISDKSRKSVLPMQQSLNHLTYILSHNFLTGSH